MTKYLITLLAVVFVLAATTDPAGAQHLRAEKTAYLRPHFGLAGYKGDSDRGFMSFDGAFPISAGVELGYQFSRPFSLSAGYTYDRYPKLTTSKDTDVRHTADLTLRYLLGKATGAAPYIQGGAFATFGEVIPQGGVEKESRTAYGPLLGLGLDVPVSSRISLFLESNFRAAFPDDALDGRDDGGFGNFDLRSSFGTGLKLNFRGALLAAKILSISGPSELHTGESGRFSAVVNERGVTRPVTYSWEWGDGGKATGLDAAHTFTQPGTYTIRFTAKNRADSPSLTKVVRVTDPPVAPSILSITADPMTPDTHTPVTFSANVRGTDPQRYRWSFGQEATSTESRPVHTFDRPGTYTVTLDVENEIGSDRRTLSLTVSPYEAEICSEVTEMSAAFFGLNESRLTPEARRILSENASILSECPNMTIRVQGYAARGERQPQRLSEDRARAVEAFYVEHGIPANRMDVRGQGVPSGATSKKDGAGLYRRVDTIPQN